MNSYEEGRKNVNDYWHAIAKAHDCEDLTDTFVQLVHTREALETLVSESIERIKALENRCRVAEDLNKVYVRMYLEMQQKYDDLARIYYKDCCYCSEEPGTGTCCIAD